jgi:hypothetical protein
LLVLNSVRESVVGVFPLGTDFLSHSRTRFAFLAAPYCCTSTGSVDTLNQRRPHCCAPPILPAPRAGVATEAAVGVGKLSPTLFAGAAFVAGHPCAGSGFKLGSTPPAYLAERCVVSCAETASVHGCHPPYSTPGEGGMANG